MQIDLTFDQAEALQKALATYFDELDRVLVRTDKRELQRALHLESIRLKEVMVKLSAQLNAAQEPTVPL
jgi:hypothetical protein